jgi:hypothetical protein
MMLFHDVLRDPEPKAVALITLGAVNNLEDAARATRAN